MILSRPDDSRGVDWSELRRDALERALRRDVDADIRFDVATRMLYSTDASIYRVEPFGVVAPRTADALAATVAIAMEHQVPIVPRGAGTSLSGQAIGPGVVIDCSRYLDRVLDVDLESRQVVVQPGCVLGQLNRKLKPLGFLFGPDVATIDRANMGGMIGNNSAGARSIRYGRTVDHVQRVDVVLTDGSRTRFGEVDRTELRAKLAQADREGEIYRTVWKSVTEHADEIRARYPKVFRRVSGYNLDALLPPAPFNLAKLIVGSEGTLATVAEATLAIVPSPTHRGMGVVEFSSIEDALATLTSILTTEPSAVELLDRFVLDLARSSVEYSRYLDFLSGRPAAIFLVEYLDDELAGVDGRLRKLRSLLSSFRHEAFSSTSDPASCERIWNVRKTAMPLLYSMPGARKPVTFVEDTAVAPERLAEFVARFREILRQHDTDGSFYGHASVGCLHIRPLLNLQSADGVRTMGQMAKEVLALVMEFGGAMSGEHGDGMCRSVFNPELFGPVVYSVFEKVKEAFDPHNLMNPGKIVNGPPMTANLRSDGRAPIAAVPTYEYERCGGMLRVVEECNGNGLCRRREPGVMCPSFRATQDERHSPRGRANLLRGVLAGHWRPETAGASWARVELGEALDLCLACKACQRECPTSVDIAKLKSEFLNERHRHHRPRLIERLIAGLPRYGRLGSRWAPLSNLILRGWLTRRWIYPRLGLDPRRKLPAYRRHTLTDWFRHHRCLAKEVRGHVVLLADCFTNYHEPHIGRLAVALIEQTGYQVHLAPICCGRTAISKGFLDEARAYAHNGVRQLLPHVEEGRPILGLEPSCLLTLTDEWLDLDDSEAARDVARSARLAEVWLHERQQGGESNLPSSNDPSLDVVVHGHCHQKAAGALEASVSAIRDLAGVEATPLDCGCCGMAGSFGYELGHYDVSVRVAEGGLLPALRQAPAAVVLAPGFSCRSQIHDLSGRRAIHPIEFIHRRTRSEPRFTARKR